MTNIIKREVIKTELVAGMTTFLTMAYIVFVNPSLLAQAGMDQGAVFVATCLSAAIGSLVMGLYANYPIGLAPGMGLNAFFTYGVVQAMGVSWQTALGAVFLASLAFLVLSLFKIREWIINSIPTALRLGIGAGIGLFLGLIALKNAGIVVDNPATLVSLGNVTDPKVLLAVLGFVLIIGLEHRQVKGGVLLSILFITILSFFIDPAAQYHGILSMPPSLMPTLGQLDITGAFRWEMFGVIFAFLFVELFDTAGTMLAVASRGNLLDEKGHLPRLKKALLADSSASLVGSVLGTSSITCYIESGAGVAAGGRTGWTAVTIGLLFLAALFFSPLAAMVPLYATAGALFYVAVLMLSGLSQLNWSDLTEAAPAAVVALLMPLTFSIANGIALGFIAFTAIKVVSGRGREVTLPVWVLSILFIIKFIYQL